MVTTKGQGRDRSLIEAKEFQVTKENCSVATGFHGVVSRQGILCHDRVLAKTKGPLVVIEYFYVATELARLGVFYRNRIFYVATKCSQMERFCVATEQFYVVT